MRGCRVGREDYETAPHVALGKGSEIEAGDYAEVVEAALKCFEEVGMGGEICIDDLTGGQDDL